MPRVMHFFALRLRLLVNRVLANCSTRPHAVVEFKSSRIDQFSLFQSSCITGTHVSYSPLRQLTSPYADQSAVDLVHELAGIATVDSAWITNDGQSVVIAAHLNNGLRFFLERSIIGKPDAQPLIVLPDTPGVSIRHISAKTIGKVSVILLEIDTLSKDDRTRILSAIVR